MLGRVKTQTWKTGFNQKLPLTCHIHRLDSLQNIRISLVKIVQYVPKASINGFINHVMRFGRWTCFLFKSLEDVSFMKRFDTRRVWSKSLEAVVISSQRIKLAMFNLQVARNLLGYFDRRYIPRIRTSKWWTCILNYSKKLQMHSILSVYRVTLQEWNYRTIYVERNHNISHCYTLEIIFLFGYNVLGNYFALLTKGKIQ